MNKLRDVYWSETDRGGGKGRYCGVYCFHDSFIYNSFCGYTQVKLWHEIVGRDNGSLVPPSGAQVKVNLHGVSFRRIYI